MSDPANKTASVAGEKGVPPVPLTLEGWSILHQMFRIRWPEWNAAAPAARRNATDEAVSALKSMENTAGGRTGLTSLLGHKGDLMLIHFRDSMDALNEAELALAQLKLAPFLEPTTSYLSVVELGLYSASGQLYRSLQEKGVAPDTPEWKEQVAAYLVQARKTMEGRLRPDIPARRYVCFYPMDKKRGEAKNWYDAPFAERQRMMADHGFIGRRYAGQVTQIISGSIGFDDWEWGVDLFADDPVVFKKLVYEMRFDEASALYGLFGPFYLGLQFRAEELGTLLEGRTPGFGTGSAK
ncbi:MAG: heme-dependent peroxidase [Deltaproteobacteria bacterium]|nr:heme-dependent peroxidase [Deltaproteobacteria bacterium]